MIYFLDSSVIVNLLRKKANALAFISDHIDDEIITSSICEMEIYAGLYREEQSKMPLRRKQVEDLFGSFYRVLSFDSHQAHIAGEIKALLSQKGEFIGDVDVLIAAAAISANAVLVTANLKHFRKVPNLKTLEVLK